MVDFDEFSHLTFDCYGTLIDWESGILAALAPVLQRHGLAVAESELLQLYAKHEARQEAGPYRTYREVLQGVLGGLAADVGFTPAPRGPWDTTYGPRDGNCLISLSYSSPRTKLAWPSAKTMLPPSSP